MVEGCSKCWWVFGLLVRLARAGFSFSKVAAAVWDAPQRLVGAEFGELDGVENEVAGGVAVDELNGLP